ncbi:MAG: rhodanese-like domain-containing protein [Methylococcales bacterium]
MANKIAQLALITGFLLSGCSMSETNNISAKQAALLQAENKAVIVDVRENSEWNQKHIPGAVHIPLDQLPKRLAELEPYKNTQIITQCQRGGRSVKAYETLKAAGFINTSNMAGGLEAWHKEGLATE